jgi:hypothetical protein
MTGWRLFLVAQALLLSAFGLAYLVDPAAMAALSGASLPAPAALTDVRAYYGALQLALGGVAGIGALQPTRQAAILGLFGLLYGALALGRLLGLLLDGMAEQGFNLGALGFEVVCAAICVIGARRG